MSTNSQQAAQTPEPVSIGSREFMLSPIPLAGIAELESWAQRRVLAAGLEVAAMLPEPAQKGARADAYAQARSITIQSEALGEILQTWAGLMQVLFLSVRVRHPEFTSADQVSSLTQDPAEIGDAAAVAFRISFPRNTTAAPKVGEPQTGGKPAAGA